MGPEEWRFVADEYALPAAVAGFTPESLLAAIYSVLRQHGEKQPFLDNCYAQVVKPGGNALAQKTLQHVLSIDAARWRGIGTIPASGFHVTPAFARYDARHYFSLPEGGRRKRAGDMPAGCDCAAVVLGRLYPHKCRLYGSACTPRHPVGPCMVSDEGACRIWWNSGQHHNMEEALA
jgi:hydrogenase expression/formation protein HypD